MNDKITFISMNCNGLYDPANRRDVLNFLKNKRFSVNYIFTGGTFHQKTRKLY